MTWVLKAKRAHRCRRPVIWPWIRTESIWRCDDCRRKWRIYRPWSHSGMLLPREWEGIDR